MGTRTETDSMGEVEVDEGRYWGAQTERSRRHFAIGTDRMPMPIIHALAFLKKAVAITNAELGSIDALRADLIVRAADEVLAGRFDEEFPLVIYQTGSGTQTNMNVNEVLSNRANELAGGVLGSKAPVHPNDHVNLSQSSNDVFPAAIHLAIVTEIEARLLPAIDRLASTLTDKATRFADIVKIGRTHLQDATPLTLGQEIGGWVAQLEHAKRAIERNLEPLFELSLGGTAVGTGLNTLPAFADLAAAHVARLTGRPYVSAPNKFAIMAGHDALVAMAGAFGQLAAASMKIANDIRWLASGPRAGLGELTIPENEPGSSIMPGKVNPTQAEALTMVAVRVMGSLTTITVAASQGNFELNVYKPVLASEALAAIRLLSDALRSFEEHCARGIEPNRRAIAAHVSSSLMLVTALTPRLGYDAAAHLAKHAQTTGKTLREAAVSLGLLTEAEFDAEVRPDAMIGPSET